MLLAGKIYYTLREEMPNQPKPGTVATSFTLPQQLLDAVQALAAREMTTKSDIIRRALMNYLSPTERQIVRQQSLRAAEQSPAYRANGNGAAAIVRTNPRGLITFISPAFSRMCGYSFSQLVDRKPGDVLQGPATEPRAVEGFRRAMRQKRRYQCTITNYDASHTAYRVRIKMHPLFEHGKLTGFEAVETRLN